MTLGLERTQTWKLHGPSWIHQEHSTPIQWSASRKKWANHGKSCPKKSGTPFSMAVAVCLRARNGDRHEASRTLSVSNTAASTRAKAKWVKPECTDEIDCPVANKATYCKTWDLKWRWSVTDQTSRITQSRILNQGECSHLGLKSYPLAWLAGSLTTGKPPMRGCFILLTRSQTSKNLVLEDHLHLNKVFKRCQTLWGVPQYHIL